MPLIADICECFTIFSLFVVEVVFESNLQQLVFSVSFASHQLLLFSQASVNQSTTVPVRISPDGFVLATSRLLHAGKMHFRET